MELEVPRNLSFAFPLVLIAIAFVVLVASVMAFGLNPVHVSILALDAKVLFRLVILAIINAFSN